MKYRMIGMCAKFDKQSDDKEALIKEASQHKGFNFTLWIWSDAFNCWDIFQRYGF